MTINIKSSFFFIVVNILVAFLGFLRSFAFMSLFNFKQLGIITLVMTGAMLISFFQIGLINGGYRIIAIQKKLESEKVNNVIFSYFLVISLFLISVYCIGIISNLIISPFILFFTLIIGLSALINNWLTNTLIGRESYKILNLSNFISSVCGLASLIFAYYFGLYGAIISLLAQPFLFVLIVLIKTPDLIPKKFDFDIKYLQYILTFGFVPFLSGLFYLAYIQIERWTVTAFLGTESLGKLYLLSLVTTLWVLIPTSINNLFFPKTVKAFSDKKILLLKRLITSNFLILIVYCCAGCLAIVFLLPICVDLVFPQHTPYLYLIKLAIYGLVFKSMADPISLFLNSIVDLKPIFWSDLVSLFIYVLFLLFLMLNNNFSLETIVIAFNIYFGARLLFLFTYYVKIKKTHYKYTL